MIAFLIQSTGLVDARFVSEVTANPGREIGGLWIATMIENLTAGRVDTGPKVWSGKGNDITSAGLVEARTNICR